MAILDEKDWRLFKVLDEVKSINNASKILYITQPAISLRIKRLEEMLQVKLVTRSSKGIELTREGKYFAEYSKEMLNRQERLKEEILNLDNKVQGTLSLAVSSSYTEYVLPSILSSFLKKYPDVQFNLKTGMSYQIIDIMKNNQAQVGIFRGEYEWSQHKILIGKANVAVISKRKIDIKKLPLYNRIIYKTDPEFIYQLNNWWNQHFDIPAKITMNVDSVTTCKKLVRDNLGYGIIAIDYLYEFEKEDLFITNLTDVNGKKITRDTTMIYTEKSLKSSIVRAFVNHIEEMFKCNNVRDNKY